MLALLQHSQTALLVSAGLLGLIVGSFLNVVIYRLPIMMERRWQAECAALVDDNHEATTEPAFNLMVPGSACPSCNKPLSIWENIPILSYLLQKGQCKNCSAGISIQYPLVEILTAALSIVAVWHFGYGWKSVAALAFTWSLITLAIIDLKTQLLPDQITLPLIWLGLLVNLNSSGFTHYAHSLLGAVFGYLSLWAIYHLFRLLTGKEGMGYGDFKLLAAIGAWLGYTALPVTIILSSFSGAVIGILLIVTKQQNRGTPIPFGPFLAIAGWIAFFWGEKITDAYLTFSGIT